MVEAVTGAGKTMVGVAAVLDEVARRGQACVVVPTTELLRQWAGVVAPLLPQGVSLGLLGDGNGACLGAVDVLVAVVNSARAADLRPAGPAASWWPTSATATARRATAWCWRPGSPPAWG